ncbi:dTDP-4-dehydrorhamnose reductase family protein [Pararobbsia alpina]|nr:SDR family oxidoreductase [Pararobbsia alpina]
MNDGERAPWRVAVLGASGLLGRAIAAELAASAGFEVVSTAMSRAGEGLHRLDLTDTPALERFFDTHRPRTVVLAAAERRPDICEHEPARARALNVTAVEAVARAARRHECRVLAISTDYVFDGRDAPYLPDAAPHPLNAYGQSKLDGEEALWSVTRDGCVLRLPLLYGPLEALGESAVTSFIPALQRASAQHPAVIDNWAIRYPTFTLDIAVVIRQILERDAAGRPVDGTHHWSGDEPMTKYAIALNLAERLDLDPSLIVAQSTPTDATPRPFDCHLDSSSLEALGIGKRTPFKQGLDLVLGNWAVVQTG